MHPGQLRDSIPAALIVQNVVAQISHNNNFNNVNGNFRIIGRESRENAWIFVDT